MNSKTMGLSVIMAGFAVFFVLTSVQSIDVARRASLNFFYVPEFKICFRRRNPVLG